MSTAPSSPTDTGVATGTIIGIVVAILVVAVIGFFIYSGTQNAINTTTPPTIINNQPSPTAATSTRSWSLVFWA